MIYYIIIAQIARGAVVWASTSVARKVFKTIAITSITFYLVERVKRQEINDRKRGVRPY